MNTETSKLSKLSRQIRIIGMCLSCDGNKKYDSFDLATMLDVEHITIQRDIHELRLMGIPIVQSKKTGIIIEGHYNSELLKHVLLKFIGGLYSTAILDLSVQTMVEKENKKYLLNFMKVLHGITTKTNLRLRVSEEYVQHLVVSPLRILQKNLQWYLLAYSNDIGLEYYAIKDILDVKNTEFDMKEIPNESINLFMNYVVYHDTGASLSRFVTTN